MLMELSVMDQRYELVMEVLRNGVPVSRGTLSSSRFVPRPVATTAASDRDRHYPRSTQNAGRFSEN